MTHVATHLAGGDGTTQSAMQKIKDDLQQLQTSQIDLLLLHFPCEKQEQNKAVWKALQMAHSVDLARAIGVSNFAKADLDAVASLGGQQPALNQCSMSIGSHDDATIKLCKSRNITYEAYSPLRHVDLGDKRIATVAAAHNKSAAVVALKWIAQQDIVVATSPGTNPEYVAEDLALPSFTLSEEEMATLAKI